MTRVLVVEDEESYSDALSYVLRKEGFEVAVAETGTHALTEFDRNGADIVLLDLMLPGMSGLDVCRAIRAEAGVPIVPGYFDNRRKEVGFGAPFYPTGDAEADIAALRAFYAPIPRRDGRLTVS